MVIVFALCLRIVLASSFPRCAGFSGAPDARLSNVGLNDLMIIKCFIDDRCSIVRLLKLPMRYHHWPLPAIIFCSNISAWLPTREASAHLSLSRFFPAYLWSSFLDICLAGAGNLCQTNSKIRQSSKLIRTRDMVLPSIIRTIGLFGNFRTLKTAPVFGPSRVLTILRLNQ